MSDAVAVAIISGGLALLGVIITSISTSRNMTAQLERCGVKVILTKSSCGENPGLTTRGATAWRNRSISRLYDDRWCSPYC
ncbi:MAG: hypothetical protein SPI76_00830 [Candidatus Fimenecus sp.]|nr:hypothetical protein [Candidatus Fimenecus sp.]